MTLLFELKITQKTIYKCIRRYNLIINYNYFSNLYYTEKSIIVINNQQSTFIWSSKYMYILSRYISHETEVEVFPLKRIQSFGLNPCKRWAMTLGQVRLDIFSRRS